MATSELAAKLAAMRKRMEEPSPDVNDSPTARTETNAATTSSKVDVDGAADSRSSFQAAKTMFGGGKTVSGGGLSAGNNNADTGKKSTSAAQRIICNEDSSSTATATTSASLSVGESLPPSPRRQTVHDPMKKNSTNNSTEGEQGGQMSTPRRGAGLEDAANVTSVNSNASESHSQSSKSIGRVTQGQIKNKSPVSTLRYDPESAMSSATCLDQSMESANTTSTSFELENRPLLSSSKRMISKSDSGTENNWETEAQHVTFESFKPIESWTEEGEGDPIIPKISSNTVRDAPHSASGRGRSQEDCHQVSDNEDRLGRMNGAPAQHPSHNLYDEKAYRDLQEKNLQLQKDLASANNLLLEKDQMIMYLTERLDDFETEHNRYLASSTSNNSSPSRHSFNGNGNMHQGRSQDTRSVNSDGGKTELKSALKTSKKNRRFLC
eukprot:CAMPEP_0116036684 /NCGR_PEP_ID=MMETSP0321-20121206/21403_1 /TAXON_ID=163516 /ORGANISM="Leptocylindrus danicus var. danicus, Strain B650" /LENGTH=437 /DNA_ID=CAMNT_0003514341 /DNA_START=75 /DNA_END=1388 /DNA_ORIENTATION=-